MEIRACKCGNEPKVIKLFAKNRADCYVKCGNCGLETRAYTSKQNAVRAWNAQRYEN